MSDKRRLVYSIIQFCQKELQADDLSDDAKESLEVIITIIFYIISTDIYDKVASQCLQSAYALNTEDKHLEVSKSLPAIFQEATKNEPVSFSSLKERVKKTVEFSTETHLLLLDPPLTEPHINMFCPFSCTRSPLPQLLTKRRLKG